MSRVVLATLMFVLLAAPTAQAYRAPRAWQREALELAQIVWRPACGPLAITYTDPDAAGVLVVSDAPASRGQVVHGAAGFTATGSCALGINSTLHWSHLGYPVFCQMVLHEAGRAAGRSGTDGPGLMKVGVFATRDISRVWRHGHWRATVHWSGVSRRCVRPMDRRAP